MEGTQAGQDAASQEPAEEEPGSVTAEPIGKVRRRLSRRQVLTYGATAMAGIAVGGVSDARIQLWMREAEVPPPAARRELLNDASGLNPTPVRGITFAGGVDRGDGGTDPPAAAADRERPRTRPRGLRRPPLDGRPEPVAGRLGPGHAPDDFGHRRRRGPDHARRGRRHLADDHPGPQRGRIFASGNAVQRRLHGWRLIERELPWLACQQPADRLDGTEPAGADGLRQDHDLQP